MYVMHAAISVIIWNTFIMLFQELSEMGALFSATMAALSWQIVWDPTEYWSGTQSLAVDPAEMLLRVQHASFTTLCALLALIPVILLFLALHRKRQRRGFPGDGKCLKRKNSRITR
jgi:hypothetical protein